MSMLEHIREPRDLKALPGDALGALAEEIRQFLVHAVARTGGHLGPNLGVVELTIALHRVFDSPADRVLWDTGHQSYVHKLLTGRQDFSKLRGKGGLSGTRPARSPSTTSSRTPTPRPCWAGPTASPRPTRCAGAATTLSPSSATAR